MSKRWDYRTELKEIDEAIKEIKINKILIEGK